VKLVAACGAYIHIPFCRVRCSYCDFNTYAGLGDLLDNYVGALCTEIGQPAPSPQPFASQVEGGGAGTTPAELASTIYLGGGTPSLLSADHLASVFAACRRRFTLAGDAEITIEANPGTVSEDSLLAMRRLGVNRLSLGVQSFDDAMLRVLDRLHSAAEARQAVAAARRAGFDNLSLDFMYGLPGQSLEHWQQTLLQALDLHPEHLSLYALTLESRVPMARRVAAGALTLPGDDAAADMYSLAEDLLETAGYRHYEISNWSSSQTTESHHNSIYWRRLPYHGFGAGAHSFDGLHRTSNLLQPRRYIAAMTSRRQPTAHSETLTPSMAMAETMFLGLRLLYEGVTAAGFAAQHGRPLTVYAEQIAELADQGLVQYDGQRLLLTRRGRLLSNQVFVRFMG
jgi:oxygen-independent coproporphyrinogen III oxidase